MLLAHRTHVAAALRIERLPDSARTAESLLVERPAITYHLLLTNVATAGAVRDGIGARVSLNASCLR